jgi:hypothetical protein
MHRQLKKYTKDIEDDDDTPKLNIQELLDNAENKLEHLQKTIWVNGTPVQQNKTMDDINSEVFEVITRYAPPEKHREYCEKLIGYRVVHELPEMHKSRFVKVLRRDTRNDNQIKLQVFGLAINIKFTDTGTLVVCLLAPRFVKQFKFNDALAVFQKLTDDEQLFISMDALL